MSYTFHFTVHRLNYPRKRKREARGCRFTVYTNKDWICYFSRNVRSSWYIAYHAVYVAHGHNCKINKGADPILNALDGERSSTPWLPTPGKDQNRKLDHNGYFRFLVTGLANQPDPPKNHTKLNHPPPRHQN